MFVRLLLINKSDIQKSDASLLFSIIIALTLFFTGNIALASNSQTHPTEYAVVSSVLLFDSGQDKAKDYGDLNDDGSHTKKSKALIIADGEGSDDRAKDYGDNNGDSSHSRLVNTLKIAEDDGSKGKSKDYGDLNDDGSYRETIAQDLSV